MIENLILNSIFCFGIYISFSEGMILSPVSRGYERIFKVIKDGQINNKFFAYLSKPLYSCVICMASVWGVVFVHFSGLTSYGIISKEMVFHVVLVAGINYLVSETIDNLKGF